MSSLKLEDLIKKSPKVNWRKVEEEGVLLNIDNGEYFRLSKVGTEIWEEIERNKTIKEMALAIAKKYDISDKRAFSDVLIFIKKLLRYGVVEVMI